MPDTKYFLDVNGLSRFKTKQDTYNAATFLGKNDKAVSAGAADTAEKLATAVTINGVPFDGSTNITVFDDDKLSTADAQKTYLTIKAADDTYLGKEATAKTAEKLANQVKINGVLFDGSAEITIADDTKLPLHGKADTAGAADTATEADHATAADTAKKLATAVTINGVEFDGSKAITINAVDSTPRIAASEKGAKGGVAELDKNGLVPSSQLPSYVDDVKEYASRDVFPGLDATDPKEVPTKDKIYVATDTGTIYRWTGTTYIEINTSVSIADKANTLVTARTIAGVSFDGSANIEIPAGNVGAYTKEETDTNFLKKKDAADTYVAKVDGKDLSDNNFTAELLAKLNGIEENANNYVLPQASSTVLGGVTVGNNITVTTGTISLSKDNVVSALGYTPSDAAAEVPVEAIANADIDALFATAG